MSNANTPKPHPHAELIKAWADGAKIQYWNEPFTCWSDTDSPTWDEDTAYRIKPEENEPWKPMKGERFFHVQSTGRVCTDTLDNTYSHERLALGNCFRTHEEAEAAAERVKAALKGEVVSKEEYQRVCTQNKALRADLKEAQKGLEIIAGNGLHKVAECELKISAPSDENFQLDGKPMTEGEAALIKALRGHRMARVITDSCVAYKNDFGDLTCDQGLVCFDTTGNRLDQEAIASALKQIQAEQEANND